MQAPPTELASPEIYDLARDELEDSCDTLPRQQPPASTFDLEPPDYLALEFVHHLPAEKSLELMSDLDARDTAFHHLLEENRRLIDTCKQLRQEKDAISEQLLLTELPAVQQSNHEPAPEPVADSPAPVSVRVDSQDQITRRAPDEVSVEPGAIQSTLREETEVLSQSSAALTPAPAILPSHLANAKESVAYTGRFLSHRLDRAKRRIADMEDAWRRKERDLSDATDRCEAERAFTDLWLQARENCWSSRYGLAATTAFALYPQGVAEKAKYLSVCMACSNSYVRLQACVVISILAEKVPLFRQSIVQSCPDLLQRLKEAASSLPYAHGSLSENEVDQDGVSRAELRVQAASALRSFV